MKLFRWLYGRQEGADYKKWCFLYFSIGRWGFDGYILKYEPRTTLLYHTDKIDGKMWRLNITLSGICYFVAEKEIIKLGQFLHLFRPDLYLHSLTTWTKTYKLSLGFAHFNKTV